MAAPTTAFEDNIAASQDPPDWTSIAQESTYLSALVDEYDTVDYEEVGRSVQDRPMHLLRIGHPVAPSAEAAASGPCVLIIAAQHGNEQASREAALIYARTLAEASGPLATYLSSVTWLIMPNANPDGVNSNSRENANAVNLNRDHIAVTQPETQAIHRVISRYQPRLIIDMHEAGVSTEIQYGRTNHSAAHAGVKAVSNVLALDYVAAEAISKGYTHAAYTSGDELWLASLIGLRHSTGMILETSQLVERPIRMQQALDMLPAIQAFDETEAEDIDDACETSRAEKIAEGLAGTTPYNTGVGTINPPPLGYELTDEQLLLLERQFSVFGIERIRPHIVSMGQAAQPLIPLILDSAAAYETVDATRLFSGVPTEHELENLSVDASAPSVDSNMSAGSVYFVTVQHGADLDPVDVALLAQYG